MRAFTEDPPIRGRFYLRLSGLAGFAVAQAPDGAPGRATCLFSRIRGKGPWLARAARRIAGTGATCDAFGLKLRALYLDAGWIQTDAIAWDDDLAPMGEDRATIEELCGPRPSIYVFRAP